MKGNITIRLLLNRFLIIIVFIISPFVASLLAFYFCIHDFDRKFNTLLLACFGGLFGYTFIPGEGFDIIRHEELFNEFLAFDFSQFVIYELTSPKPDFLIELIYWFVGRIFFNSQIVGFIGAFSFYYLMLLVIENSLRNVVRQRTPYTYFFCVAIFMAITVTWQFSGMRNGNAVLLFMYLITSNINYLKRKNQLLLLLPGIVHFSLLPICILYFLCLFLKRKQLHYISILLILSVPFILLILSSLHGVLDSLGYIGHFFAAKIDSYIIDGTDASMYTGAGFRYYLVVIPMLILFPFVWKTVNQCSHDSRMRELPYHHFSILFFSYVLCLGMTYAFSRNLLLCIYLFSVYFLSFLYFVKCNAFLKRIVYIFLIYACLSIVPSWYMGKEYRCINPILFTGSLHTILTTEITENDYWPT